MSVCVRACICVCVRARVRRRSGSNSRVLGSCFLANTPGFFALQFDFFNNACVYVRARVRARVRTRFERKSCVLGVRILLVFVFFLSFFAKCA